MAMLPTTRYQIMANQQKQGGKNRKYGRNKKHSAAQTLRTTRNKANAQTREHRVFGNAQAGMPISKEAYHAPHSVPRNIRPLSEITEPLTRERYARARSLPHDNTFQFPDHHKAYAFRVEDRARVSHARVVS
jgi:hypothetical protein